MKTLSLSELERLAQIYVVANTPSYLYRHFKKDPAVEDLAKTNSVAELVSTAKIDGATAARSLPEIVSAYAALIALTLKDYNQISNTLREGNFPGLHWAKDIVRVWDRTRISTQTLPVSVQFLSVVRQPSAITSDQRLVISVPPSKVIAHPTAVSSNTNLIKITR